ncbi:type 1 glutamine amidotransferase domain-containing protein [Hymenobacter canadensis]|uniref:Type 1 glutamine amidotransferase n=1 Tax=Hymenobacter canadensis TaxID=2999067 RepID=A0ABY7LMW5_9BACT|nr:type 1 glutamine amidotransferase domain-containing protein [Hymenobacter canadensis]WBA40792.1 type 1 glutamine amidotransferase [Hymenobacter canadensis]
MSIFGSDSLKGKTIAIVATDGFEQSELEKPKKYLEDEGAEIHVISLKSGSIKGWDEKDWGDKVSVDKVIGDVKVAEYDALVLPGGQMNPDILRTEPAVISFIGEFVRSGKPVAAICHGPWLLIEADVVRGKKLASWPSLKTDIKNAGAHWVDETVVVDGNLITSRNPQDIPNFNEKIKEALVGKK